MKKQYALLPQKFVIAMFAFLGAVLLVATFFDFQISTSLYNEASAFGIFFAAFGEYPAAMGFVAAGTLLWRGHNKLSKIKGVLQRLGGAWMVISGSAMAMLMPSLYLELPMPLIICIGLACSVGVVFIISHISKSADRGEMIKVAAVIFCVLFAEMIAVNIIKIPWGRVRMRHIAVDARAYFMPWWQPGTELSSSLIASGVAAEEFKSFPSGHTANAASLMLLGLLPRLCQKLESKKIMLVFIGAGWGCTVALSRIVMGAHFLSDTVIGFAVCFTTILLICQWVFKAGKPKQGKIA